MKKQNKTSSTPLNWWFEEPKDDVIGYYIGTSPVVKGEVVTLDGSDFVVKDISSSFSSPFSYSFTTSWLSHDGFMNYSIEPNGKKTLKVSKKEDIKFD
jgi:hypothetical protein